MMAMPVGFVSRVGGGRLAVAGLRGHGGHFVQNLGRILMGADVGVRAWNRALRRFHDFDARGRWRRRVGVPGGRVVVCLGVAAFLRHLHEQRTALRRRIRLDAARRCSLLRRRSLGGGRRGGRRRRRRCAVAAIAVVKAHPPDGGGGAARGRAEGGVVGGRGRRRRHDLLVVDVAGVRPAVVVVPKAAPANAAGADHRLRRPRRLGPRRRVHVPRRRRRPLPLRRRLLLLVSRRCLVAAAPFGGACVSSRRRREKRGVVDVTMELLLRPRAKATVEPLDRRRDVGRCARECCTAAPVASIAAFVSTLASPHTCGLRIRAHRALVAAVTPADRTAVHRRAATRQRAVFV
mmetsp:Transcript_38483/g.118955  ORF Transcript_38483/g.118955 Transcript_38483/m.118955 type:complete len:348 (-) Transcript_38483:222-1265(-)